MGQAQINVRTRACSRTSIARTKQAALTHSVRGKRLRYLNLPGDSRNFSKSPRFINNKTNFIAIVSNSARFMYIIGTSHRVW